MHAVVMMIVSPIALLTSGRYSTSYVEGPLCGYSLYDKRADRK